MTDSAAPTRLDPQTLRADFPILATVNRFGKPLVYLDSAATSLKPRPVIDAVNAYNSEYSSNIHRASTNRGARHGPVRGRPCSVAKLINASDASEIRLRPQRHRGHQPRRQLVGSAQYRAGRSIVLTEMEHHANLVPWQLLVQEKDGDLEFVPITDDGILRLDVYEALLHLHPKLVAFTHVSNMLGTINPVRELAEMAHKAGALVLIDGAQAVPHLPVDVQAIARTSTSSPATRCSAQRVRAPFGLAASCSRRCRRSWPAAT